MKALPLCAAFFCVTLTACNTSVQQQKTTSAPQLMTQYGCPTCHVIRGVPGAVGKVGPSLDDVAQRSYLAGSVENTPSNLTSWIQHPQHYRPGTAMPEMGVTDADARKIARFLQTSE